MPTCRSLRRPRWVCCWRICRSNRRPQMRNCASGDPYAVSFILRDGVRRLCPIIEACGYGSRLKAGTTACMRRGAPIVNRFTRPGFSCSASSRSQANQEDKSGFPESQGSAHHACCSLRKGAFSKEPTCRC
jgi:hypothetical protein